MSKGIWTVKVIKLKTGEEIISLIKIRENEEQSVFQLKSPMIVSDDVELFEQDDDEDDFLLDQEEDNMKRFSMSFAITLLPWFQFGENKNVEISASAIIAVTEPTNNLQGMYNNALRSISEHAKREKINELKEKEVINTINDLLNNNFTKNEEYNEFNEWFESLNLEGINIPKDDL